jgi:integrase
MARQVERLTNMEASKTNKQGMHADGGGLYLQVSRYDTKAWIYRYTLNGSEHRIGLGPFPLVSLKEARELARQQSRLKSKGIDPLAHKRTQKVRERLEAANTKTFAQCALEYIEVHQAGWRNAKHQSQWRNTLATYAYPFIGDLSVQAIDGALVLKVLNPIWTTKTETAQRVRQRIEKVLDWATVGGYRQGENPAQWRGRLQTQLADPGKLRKVKHHPALPHADIPELFDWLKTKDTLASKALAFTILTAARNGESRQAIQSELDLSKPAWTIPEERMKAGRAHTVPLSSQALVVLKQSQIFASDERIFPGMANGKYISETAMRKLLAEFREGLTIHGFRSTFRDWCAEETNYPRELAEAALAHSNKDKVEAAYQRGDLFQKRLVLMQDWANYCLSGKRDKGRVVDIQTRLVK